MSDPCCACFGSGNVSTTAGTFDNGPTARRQPCIECKGSGRQNAEQQAIVDAINARVKERLENA